MNSPVTLLGFHSSAFEDVDHDCEHTARFCPGGFFFWRGHLLEIEVSRNECARNERAQWTPSALQRVCSVACCACCCCSRRPTCAIPVSAFASRHLSAVTRQACRCCWRRAFFASPVPHPHKGPNLDPSCRQRVSALAFRHWRFLLHEANLDQSCRL